MKPEEARKVCQDFALRHKVVFEDEGECGFGRECVGFKSGDCWVDHNPYNRNGSYEPLKEFVCEDAWAPEGVNAYHKHDCLAVLGRGDEAVMGLALWVKKMEAAGEVKIVSYETGATGMQALMSGTRGMTVVIDK